MITASRERGPAAARWRAAADVLTIVLVAAAAMAWWWGRRWTFGGIRVSLSPARVLIVAALIAVARHAVVPRPAIHTSVRRFARAVLDRSPALRAALPVWCATRPTVLLLGLVAVLMVGYPTDTPPRIAFDEVWNLPFRWDAAWYMSIAAFGYQWSGAAATQQNLAFFPAFPALMRAFSALSSAHLPLEVRLAWTGTVLSLAAFLAGLAYLYRLFADRMDDDAARAGLVFLATYPFAIFFSVPYTESVYLLGTAGAFYHLRREQTAAAAAWALLVGLSRPNGCLLALPLGLVVWQRRDKARPAELAAVAMPIVGMLAYSAYIYSLTGRPFVWAELQTAWGRTFQGVAGTIGGVGTALQQFALVRSPRVRVADALNAAGAVFALLTIWPVARRLGIEYGAFVALGAVVPLVTGLDAMGRYTSVLFPAFMWLGIAVPARHRMTIAAAFAMGQGAIAMLFFTWRPIF